ncbi:4-oxalocrotonate tautomerase [Neobacillus bataviensis]|uniref:4-oxalocrotonate tautomerase n=1 Tax=Neobacillus bataviensis TaxID=220685 RepID=A0A561CQA2_9BACI|nr:tautomerase family protein [Neobacillus bataviensis]TWD93411.1 4-oxalocrotonate tautomerase [Neobacillus bataviensis]
MPHIIVKLLPGRTENQKKELTDKIVQAVMETVNAGEESISVSFEEIPNGKWAEEVYKPDILGKEKTLYKKPGYSY